MRPVAPPSREADGGPRARLAGLVLAAATTAACQGARDLDLTRAGACPFRTAAEWQRWLDREAQGGQWVKTCDDGGCDAASYDAVEANVATVFQQCDALLADNPSLHACTDRLRRFTSSWMEQHDPLSYGFTTDNEAYFAAQTGPDMPEGMMAPPAALLSKMPDLGAVEEAARDSGWPYVVQSSCLGGVRLFVVTPDPAGKFDQWTLMNLRSAAPTSVSSLVSFLAVQKTDAAGAPLPAVRVHFRDYVVASSPGGTYSLTSDDRDNAKCYSCHTSGVRRLLAARSSRLDAKPVRGEPGFTEDGAYVPADFAFQRLTALNDRLASYGLNDWNGEIVVADHGPVLGAEQGCTACHDGRTRGVLTVSTSRRQLQHKVVTELVMPPTPGLTDLVERQAIGPPLTDAEAAVLEGAEWTHAVLLADLEAASAPALKAWLLQTPCE